MRSCRARVRQPTRYEVLQHLAQRARNRRLASSSARSRAKERPARPVIVEEDVSRWQRDYILERADQFPGVEIAPRYVRTIRTARSPRRCSAMSVCRQREQIKADPPAIELERHRRRVGRRGGLRQLSARAVGAGDAAHRLARSSAQRVDSEPRAAARRHGAADDRRQSSVGSSAGASARHPGRSQLGLYRLLERRRRRHRGAQRSADGSVLAMATYPTYPPSVFSGRVTTSRLARWGLTPARPRR